MNRLNRGIPPIRTRETPAVSRQLDLTGYSWSLFSTVLMNNKFTKLARLLPEIHPSAGYDGAAKYLILAVSVTVICLINTAAHANEIVFPDDERAVINVRDFGAAGDGETDDTAALQRAFEAATDEGRYTRFVYLPEGTYRITDRLIFRRPGQDGREGSHVGPWVYGQKRDTTIIRLDDNLEKFSRPDQPMEVIRGIVRPDGAGMNADFFDRTIVNLTIDSGDNPGAVGIKFYSNNTGVLRHVLIRGNGAVGLDLGNNDQNGPLLVQDVEIDGFAIGVNTGHIINSQTLSRIAVRNAREVGLRHRGQMLAVEALRVTGSPLSVDSEGGVLTLVDCRFEGPDGATGPAIRLEDGYLYAARIETTGYSQALVSNGPLGDVSDANISEYYSHDAHILGNSPAVGLLLAPRDEPKIPWPSDADQWVCVNDFGADPTNNEDDSEAIQAAIDEAARRGASTVYFLGYRGEPNWYFMRNDVRLHGSVERIMGFGFVRLFSGPGGDPVDADNYPDNMNSFIVNDEPDAPQTVIFQHLQVFSPWEAFAVKVNTTERQVVFDSFGGVPLVGPGATAYMTNCVGHLYMEEGASVFARQWNTERGPEITRINTRNDGGRLWVLGMKTEGISIKSATFNGGQTEILGMLNYNHTGSHDDEPAFLVEDAALSVTGYREVNFTGDWWRVTALAELDGEKHQLGRRPWHTWALLRVGAED